MAPPAAPAVEAMLAAGRATKKIPDAIRRRGLKNIMEEQHN